jgi:DedD protein
MDRALKERVIGAVVLVVIAVLVVPVFLDGPPTDAQMVSEPVTLPGQNGQSHERQTIVLERDRDQPMPASARASEMALKAAPPAVDHETATQPERDNPAPEPQAEPPADAGPASVAETKPAVEHQAAPAREKPAEAASPPPKQAEAQSATGMWAVQLGSFSNAENAERLAATLRSEGYAAFLSELHTGTGDLHRVRIGPQKDRDSAEAVAAKLGKEGHEGQVVPHP